MTIMSVDQETTGYGFTFTAYYQPLIVKQGVFLVSDDNDAVNFSASFYDNSLQNFGTILGNGAATFRSSGNAIYNMESGVMTSDGTAIYDFVGSNTVNNAGIIKGAAGVYASGSYERVINSGLIEGNYSGLILSGAGNVVMNSGTIRGPREAISAGSPTASLSLRNTGTIDGQIVLGDGGNSVVNQGLMTGDVNLGGGRDTFNGRGGTVSGTIDGGAGADRILAGSGGGMLGGGAGHDRLVGGLGADTFVIASFGSGDSDVIRRFDVAKDLIQLDQSVFSHLKLDVTPTFAVGTQATSATDFLFYNSGTGGFFYDVDGNGSRTPYLVVTLDKGLKLTASNIDVV